MPTITMEAVSEMLDHGLDAIAAWPQCDRATLTLLVPGAVGLIAVVRVALHSARFGTMLLQRTIDEVARRIQANLQHPYDLRAEVAWEIGKDVQRRAGAPFVSEPMIQEAIRTARLRDEENYRRRVDPGATESALKVLERASPPFLSIAGVNPIYAYALSILGIAAAAFAFQCLLTLTPGRQAVLPPVLSGLAVLVQLWLILMAVRASRDWSERLTDFDRCASSNGALLLPKRHILLDFFLIVASSNDTRRVAIAWAPLWEMITFTLAPAMIVATAMGALLHICMKLGAPKDLLVLLLIVGGAAFIGCLFLGTIFLSWHNYKYLDVRRLRARLFQIERDLVRAMRIRSTSTSHLRTDHRAVQLQLWAITGDDIYRDPGARLRKLDALVG